MQVTKGRLEARLFARHAKIVRDLYHDPDSHPEIEDSVGLWHRSYQWIWAHRWNPNKCRFSRGFRRWSWGWAGVTAGIYREDARRRKGGARG